MWYELFRQYSRSSENFVVGEVLVAADVVALVEGEDYKVNSPPTALASLC